MRTIPLPTLRSHAHRSTRRASSAQQDPLVLQDPTECREAPEWTVSQEHPDSPDAMDRLDHLDRWETPACPETPVRWDLRDHPVRMDSADMENRELPDPSDLLACQEILVLADSRDRTVRPDRKDRSDSPALLEIPAAMDNQELPVVLDCPETTPPTVLAHHARQCLSRDSLTETVLLFLCSCSVRYAYDRCRDR